MDSPVQPRLRATDTSHDLTTQTDSHPRVWRRPRTSRRNASYTGNRTDPASAGDGKGYIDARLASDLACLHDVQPRPSRARCQRRDHGLGQALEQAAGQGGWALPHCRRRHRDRLHRGAALLGCDRQRRCRVRRGRSRVSSEQGRPRRAYRRRHTCPSSAVPRRVATGGEVGQVRSVLSCRNTAKRGRRRLFQHRARRSPTDSAQLHSTTRTIRECCRVSGT